MGAMMPVGSSWQPGVPWETSFPIQVPWLCVPSSRIVCLCHLVDSCIGILNKTLSRRSSLVKKNCRSGFVARLSSFGTCRLSQTTFLFPLHERHPLRFTPAIPALTWNQESPLWQFEKSVISSGRRNLFIGTGS